MAKECAADTGGKFCKSNGKNCSDTSKRGLFRSCYKRPDSWLIESPALGIISRHSVYEPLQTRLIAIDSKA